MVYFTKKIPVAETGYTFIIKITYELSISDDPFASYAENHDYFFESRACFLQDEGGKDVFSTRPRIDTLDDFATLEYFFSRQEQEYGRSVPNNATSHRCFNIFYTKSKKGRISD